MRSLAPALAGVLILAIVPSLVHGADEFLFFTGKAVDSRALPEQEQGILVQGITIKKGDTLKALAKKYRGRAAYFPQILLFNQITNPDLIRTGSKLLIPVRKSSYSASKRNISRRPAVISSKKRNAAMASQTEDESAGNAQQRYRQAVTAYKQGHFRQALEELDRFLADFPASPLAADASLYRADCLLNLSRQ